MKKPILLLLLIAVFIIFIIDSLMNKGELLYVRTLLFVVLASFICPKIAQSLEKKRNIKKLKSIKKRAILETKSI